MKTQIEANIEFKTMGHFIPSDFSNLLVNDDNLEKMFKEVDALEEEAPKSLKTAQKIIKKMQATTEDFESLDNGGFWHEYSQIVTIAVLILIIIWQSLHSYQTYKTNEELKKFSFWLNINRLALNVGKKKLRHFSSK